MWFAFRLYLWLIDSQHGCRIITCHSGCDLLSDCIFDLLIHSKINGVTFFYSVVICFQIVSLTYWFTADKKRKPAVSGLWFAFRLYLWLIDSQRCFQKREWQQCCDLLSDCIFDLLIHSKTCRILAIQSVVICFQIVSLTYWFTAVYGNATGTPSLWFAFRLYLWLIDSQRTTSTPTRTDRCDLLSDCIFDLLIHSNNKAIQWHGLLWFAFRLYLWLIDSQQPLFILNSKRRCDLLSDCIFDLLIHSRKVDKGDTPQVVICFQIVSLTYWFTALLLSNNFPSRLWFAFRLYLWLIDSQRFIDCITANDGCDLLSDCIFDLLIHSLWDTYWSST